jgi:hypothetical protein
VRKLLAGLAGIAVFGGLLVAVPNANADPVEGGGWTSYSPSYVEAERGCGQIDGLRFRLTCNNPNPYQRAERWYTAYRDGTRQFEGSFRIISMTGNRISLKQTFRNDHGAYFMLAVERSGRLYSVNGGVTVGSGATVGVTVRVNTVHETGRSHRLYINGSLRHTAASPGNDRYHDKFGAYATASGQGPITVVWNGIRFWRK